jgi:thiamine monophosphate kinase
MLRQKKSHEEHGRAWWIFSGLSAPKKYEKTWIEQFRKGRFEDASKE